MGRYWAGVGDVVKVVASGDALCCTVVCPGLGITFKTLIHEGWLSRAQNTEGTSARSDGNATQLILDLASDHISSTTLPDPRDSDREV